MKEETKVGQAPDTKLIEVIPSESCDNTDNVLTDKSKYNTTVKASDGNKSKAQEQPKLKTDQTEDSKLEYKENAVERSSIKKEVDATKKDNRVENKINGHEENNGGKVTVGSTFVDSLKSNKNLFKENKDARKQQTIKTTDVSPENDKKTTDKADANDEKAENNVTEISTPNNINENKAPELERRESRIGEKLAFAVHVYQEALERRLKDSQRTNDIDEEDDDDSSEPGLALWRRAKMSLLKKMKNPTQDDDHEGGKGHKLPLHRRKRTSVPQGRQSGYSCRRRSITEMQNALKRKLALQRFRRAANLIIFCRRCVQDHCFKYREKSELAPYMQTLNYMDYTADQVTDLMFDRTKFRADRQMRISEQTKEILSKRKSQRTEHEIYSAQIALRNNRSFSEYPARMQQMMAECGHYEAYEAKRVVTREGHPPAAFYFVLSGAVVAMQLDQGRNIASAVAEFVKGDTFEEKPMLTNTPRQYTVLTKEPCEFLSISEKDYKNIFMQGGVKTLNDPDQELFLKSLNFLKGWPIKILQDHPTKSLFHYYKRGSILAMDTRQCEWLITVKSGSLSVLKKLKRVGPYEWKKNVIKPLTEKEKRERQEKKTLWRRFILPELRLPLRKHNEVDEIEELVDGRPKPFQHPDIKVQFEEEGREKKGKKYCYPSLWTIKRGVEDDDKDQQQFSNINKQYLYLMSSSGNKDQDKSVRHRPVPSTASTQQKDSSKMSTIEERSLTSPSLSEHTIHSAASTPEPHAASSLSSLIGSADFDERIRNIMEDVYSDDRRSLENTSEMDLKPEFVKVQTLVKGGVWGLADLILEEQTGFTIVSNGADCVLINKQFYLEHAPEKLIRKLRHDLCPYPSDDDLQQGLQISVDWNDYRRNELSSTMDVVKGKRLMRDIVLGGSAVEDIF